MAAALVGGGTGGFGAQSSIDTLMQAGGPQEVQAPPDATQDKISFVLNNMSPTNVPAKSEELRQIIEEAECVPWFAHYLVVKRVSLEPNFHGIYATMVECLAMKPLNNAILQATLSNARVLISSGKIRSSSSERSLLKNLGAWLGLITLARNKPLLLRDLDMKELICDAYERGLLIAVVPFVAKILDAASASRVFMPPNPWVMGIMMVLVELGFFWSLLHQYNYVFLIYTKSKDFLQKTGGRHICLPFRSRTAVPAAQRGHWDHI